MSFSTVVLILVSAVSAVGLLWWGIWLIRTEAKRLAHSGSAFVGESAKSKRLNNRNKQQLGTEQKLSESVGVSVDVSESVADASVAADQEVTEIVSSAAMETELLDTEAIGIAEAETVVIADIDVVNLEEKNV